MDFALRKKYYNLCNPYESLGPDDDQNVDLDQLFPENPVRGINWSKRLAAQIAFSDEPVCELFTGLPGSGKTTELRRLSKSLAEPERTNLLPILVNTEELIDLTAPIEVTDIMSALVYAVEREVYRATGVNPDKAMEEGYCKRLYNWLKETNADLAKAEFQIPSAGKLVFEMKTRPSLRAQIRNTMATHLSEFLARVHDELLKLQARVQKKLKRAGIVVILDSLEKLRGISTNWTDVLLSAERIFGSGAMYMRLPVHVIYTVPAALSRRIEIDHFLPVVKVRERNSDKPFEPGKPNRDGVNAMRELIGRRLPDDFLAEVLGAGHLEKRLEDLILLSGGYPRDLLIMVREMIHFDTYPLSNKLFSRLKTGIANKYREIVPVEAFEMLARVAQIKFLPTEEDEARGRIADRMLANHAILRYRNDKLWFELHPAVREIPGVQEAIDALRDAS